MHFFQHSVISGSAIQRGAMAVLLISASAFCQPERVLTLDAALQLARQRSRDLAAARSRREQAEAGVQQAWASLLPVLSAQGKYTRNYKEVELDFTPFNAGVLGLAETLRATSSSPSQSAALDAFEQRLRDNTPAPAVIQPRNELDAVAQLTLPLIVPSAYLGLSAARRSSEAAAANYASSDAAVLLQAAQAFYALAGAQELLLARHHAVEVARETTAVAQSRLESGVANRVDLQRAQVALLRAQQAEIEAADGQAQARRNLATLLDLREGFRVDPGQGPEEISTPAEDLAREALRRRPEVLGLERNLDALDAQAKAAGWRWAPNLSGFANYRAFNYRGFSGDQYSWAVGAQLDWVLYDGGARDAQRHLATAQRGETEARLSLLRDTVLDEISNSQRSVETKKSALNTAQKSTELSRSTLDLVRAQYEVGTATQLDLFQAQDSLVAAEVTLAQARFDLALATLALQRSAGVFPDRENP
jgi:outer membrane protein TolC